MSFLKDARLLAVCIVFAGAGSAGGLALAAGPASPAAAAAPAASSAPATAGNTMGYGVKLGGFFSDQHKQAAKRYFSTKYAKSKDCPEGMQRSGKTCKPPVEGRYWAVGQPLQKAVQTYPIPEQLASQLPEAPQGYEYVRAGDDILLVSKGMHLVVDMIQDVMG